MKKAIFKVGDKVFAKVKGYPPWPAKVVSENGKKYKVEFYGTGEIGIIKVEGLYYYIRNKEKFQKPLKRKDYVDAFEQIELAIKEDGGDGDPSSTNESDSFNNTTDSLNVSNVTVTAKSGKRTNVKRKRSSEKPQEVVKRDTRSKSQELDQSIIVPEEPLKKSPKLRKSREHNREAAKSKEIEFIPVNNKKDPSESTEITRKVSNEENFKAEEGTESLDFKVHVISEKFLHNNIAYAKHVKESESYYKKRPVEPREDYINQALPVKTKSGEMGGLKLHSSWPLIFENEYDRAIYDEIVANQVLNAKNKCLNEDSAILNNAEKFIPNIELTAEDIKRSIYTKEIESKEARIKRLKIEADLASLDAKIKNCLGLEKAEPEEAIGYLEEMCKLDFDAIILKKHSHIVEMVRRLRKYVGNTAEWNMSEESLKEFSNKAEKVRAKAEDVYSKFKDVMKLSENSGSFWDGFSELASKFKEDCKGLTEAQIYVLCAEPRSRRAFLDRLDEMDSEKENSSGAANSEIETTVNGTEAKAAGT